MRVTVCYSTRDGNCISTLYKAFTVSPSGFFVLRSRRRGKESGYQTSISEPQIDRLVKVHGNGEKVCCTGSVSCECGPLRPGHATALRNRVLAQLLPSACHVPWLSMCFLRARRSFLLRQELFARKKSMARGKVGSRPGTNSRTGSRAGTGGGNTSKYVAAPPSKRLMRNGLEAPETPEAERASVPGGRPPVPPSNNVKSLMRRAFRQEEEGDAGLLQIGQPVENDDVNLIQHIVVVPTKEEIKMQLKDLRSDYAKVRQGAVDRIGVVARDNFDNPEFQVRDLVPLVSCIYRILLCLFLCACLT